MDKLNLDAHICSVAFSDSPLLKNMAIRKMLMEDKPDGITCEWNCTLPKEYFNFLKEVSMPQRRW